MLSELLEAKFREIEADAERRRAAAGYIVSLIESDETLFREAFFGDDIKPEDYAQADADLYDAVEDTINRLTDEHIRPFGATLYSLKPGDNSMPSAKLGWATYEPLAYMEAPELAELEEVPHTQRLTEPGVNVINGLRAVLGLPTLEDQRQRNRAMWGTAMSDSTLTPSA